MEANYSSCPRAALPDFPAVTPSHSPCSSKKRRGVDNEHVTHSFDIETASLQSCLQLFSNLPRRVVAPIHTTHVIDLYVSHQSLALFTLLADPNIFVFIDCPTPLRYFLIGQIWGILHIQSACMPHRYGTASGRQEGARACANELLMHFIAMREADRAISSNGFRLLLANQIHVVSLPPVHNFLPFGNGGWRAIAHAKHQSQCLLLWGGHDGTTVLMHLLS